MDTHGTPVPEREGCGWPTTRATNVHNQKTDTTVFTNVHGSGAVLSPASPARVQQRTEQVVQRRHEVDGQFVGKSHATATENTRKHARPEDQIQE